MEIDPAKRKLWAESWQFASVELEKLRRQELAAMTDEDVRAAIQAVMGLTDRAWRRPEERTTSGLVEQQRYFSHGHHQRSP